MYETYSAFKDHENFSAFVIDLHMSVVRARELAVNADNEYQAYRSKEGSEDYNDFRAIHLLDDSIHTKNRLKALEKIEREFFSSLSEDAKNEMDRLYKQTDEYMQSVRKAG